MARLEMNDSITTLISDLQAAAYQDDKLIQTVLKAQTEIVEPAIRASAVSSGLVKTGTLRDSIGHSSRKKGLEIRIGPSGVHHRYIRKSGSGEVRSGHVGYIHEYGIPSRGIPAKKWMSKAVQASQSKAFDVAEKIHDEYLKKHNL